MTTDEEKLVTDNINLAYDIAWKYYKKFNKLHDLEELQSIAFLGLTKAAKTFISELGYTFSTYAYRCITNEILIYNREYNKNFKNILSLDVEIENSLTLSDMLPFEIDFINELNKEEYLKKLEYEINNLSDRHKKIMIYRLQGLKMVEIGKILGICQPQVSRDYNTALNILRNKFKNWGGDI